MREMDDEARALTPEESWRSIHTTMDSARSSMYVAGAATIALLWGGIAALGYLSQYALQTFAPDVMTSSPWINPAAMGRPGYRRHGGQRHHRISRRPGKRSPATRVAAPASGCSCSG